MIIKFKTTSGSLYSYDDQTMMFDRYLRGPEAYPLRADAGKCTREPSIMSGFPVAFYCESLVPGGLPRLVVTTPIVEFLDDQPAQKAA